MQNENLYTAVKHYDVIENIWISEIKVKKLELFPRKPRQLRRPLRFVQFGREICPIGEYLWLNMVRAADER